MLFFRIGGQCPLPFCFAFLSLILRDQVVAQFNRGGSPTPAPMAQPKTSIVLWFYGSHFGAESEPRPARAGFVCYTKDKFTAI